MQRLALPINDLRMTAAYLNAKYAAQFGFPHYGIDATSASGKTPVYALGAGTVFACGIDALDGKSLTGPNSRLGNCVIIIYKDVLRNDGVVCDLACRMFHLASIAVKNGQAVKTGDAIGHYGNTGAKTTGAHLHIEFDTDIKYPQYAFGVVGGSVVKKGTVNSTVNPSKVWFKGPGQSIVGCGNGYTFDADTAIPSLPDTATGGTVPLHEFEAVSKALDEALADKKRLEAEYDELAKLHDQLLRDNEATISLAEENAEMRKDIAALAAKWPV